MAISLQPTDADRNAAATLIGNQVGIFQQVLFASEPPSLAGPTLREAFRLHVTRLDLMIDSGRSGEPLAKVCCDSGIWHHQIAIGPQVDAFARISTAPDRLLELMNGVLSTRLAKAIQKTNEQFNDDYLVTLVRAIDASIYFFLVTKGTAEHVVVISSLYSQETLPLLSLFSAPEFIAKLRKLPRFGGVRFDRETDDE